MKRIAFILAIAAGALVGCASSNEQGTARPMVNEPAGSQIATNQVDTQSRDVNQKPYWQPQPLQDQ